MLFNFESPQLIIFGAGKSEELPTRIASLGSRVLFVIGSATERWSELFDRISATGIEMFYSTVENEPSLEIIDRITTQARECNADLIVGIGGGSVIDTAKAVGIMAPNSGAVLDYLEVIGKGQPFSQKSLPTIAVPTTSGTGAEVTKNAVLFSPEHAIKVSMRSSDMIPDIALIDPDLTTSVPAHITAYTGMDALTQVIEPFVSCMSNEFTDTLCREAIAKASPALLKAFNEPMDIEARTNLSYVSLMGGLALANAKLGAVHGFAGPIGGMFNAPHGAICAALLPYVLQANIKAVTERGTKEQQNRYEELALLLTRNPMAEAEDSVRAITQLNKSLNIKGLAEYGVTAGKIDSIVAVSKNTSSMKGNTIPLTDDELAQVIFRAL
ncbi:MAG: iron-containing alcohol dehydrogenase [Fibrobacterales bacterium]